MSSTREVVKRNQFADYLNIGSTETPNFTLMGTGFTTLDEEPGAQTESKKYVNESSKSTSVTGYETKFPFESDFICSQDVILALYNVGRNHSLGLDSEFEYVRVELWDKKGENEFSARKFLVSAEISSISGETDMTVSGNLNALGDFVDGTFNTVTRIFTEGVSDEESNTVPNVDSDEKEELEDTKEPTLEDDLELDLDSQLEDELENELEE